MKNTSLLIYLVAAIALLTSYTTAFAQRAAAAPETSNFMARAGFLPIIIYLLCVCLIYKGVEIYQIALMSNNENKTTGFVVGVIAIAISVIIAIIAFNMVNSITGNTEKMLNKIWFP
jgi:hypothetical protein